MPEERDGVFSARLHRSRQSGASSCWSVKPAAVVPESWLLWRQQAISQLPKFDANETWHRSSLQRFLSPCSVSSSSINDVFDFLLVVIPASQKILQSVKAKLPKSVAHDEVDDSIRKHALIEAAASNHHPI